MLMIYQSKHLNLRISAIITIVILLAGCSTASPATPIALAVSPTPIATLSPSALSYPLDLTQSQIKYLATGLLNAQYPGTFKVTGQRVVLTPEGSGYRVQLTLTFDVKSATATDSFMRNTLLSSLEADRYPVATLALESKGAVQLDAAQSAAFTLSGTYTLHGQQQTVDLPVTLSLQGDTVRLNGSMIFKLSAYHVQISGFVVNDAITFTANLVAKRAETF